MGRNARISSNEGDGNDIGIWFQQGLSGAASKVRRALVGADKAIPLGAFAYHPSELAATIKLLHGKARQQGQSFP